jgi:hypothetical protein
MPNPFSNRRTFQSNSQSPYCQQEEALNRRNQRQALFTMVTRYRSGLADAGCP